MQIIEAELKFTVSVQKTDTKEALGTDPVGAVRFPLNSLQYSTLDIRCSIFSLHSAQTLAGAPVTAPVHASRFLLVFVCISLQRLKVLSHASSV